MKTLRVVIALGVLVGLGWFAPALATADGCAVVLRTPDGFLNLREGPSVETRVVAKLSRGDLLYVDTAQCGRVKGRWICDERSEWGHVTQVPRFDGSDPRQSTSGWVSDKFVQWFECPEPKAVAIPAPAPAIAKTMPQKICDGVIKAVVSEAKDWNHHPHNFVGGVPLRGKALKIIKFDPEGSCFLIAEVIDFPEGKRS